MIEPTPQPAERLPDVASERARVRRLRGRREWRRMPLPFVLALVLHLIVLVWLQYQLVAARQAERSVTLSASLMDSAEELPPEPEPEPHEPLEWKQLEVEPVVSEQLSDELPREVPDLLGLGGSGSGTRGALGAQDVHGAGLADGLSTGGEPFQRFVSGLRRRGVEVAFVVDATGSMQAFIDRAGDVIDGLAADLSAVVPGVRLAIVAYRDLGDDWVTRKVDFADHPWMVSNFLAELRAEGGMRETPDFEEAVEVGLEVAVDQLSWTPGARQVIVVVGDAPWHEDDVGQVMALARRFSRREQSSIDTIHVGAREAGQPTEATRRARQAWEKLARTGGGTAFDLLLPDEPPKGSTTRGRYRLGASLNGPAPDPASRELHHQIMAAVFGSDWSGQVEAWVRGGRRDARTATVARRVARGDRAWVAQQLLEKPTHPELVSACDELFDGALAAVCYRVLADESRPEALRWAVLSILRRRLPDARAVPFDPRLPIADQAASLAFLQRRVAALPGATTVLAGQPPPAPAPAPALPRRSGAEAGG